MKGLSFSEPMVKAWMEGRKTVTRRLIKQANDIAGTAAGAIHPARISGYIAWWPGNVTPEFTKSVYERGFLPRYLPGETVYIKETWAPHADDEATNFHRGALIFYKADGDDKQGNPHINRWRSPMMMPEWAARSHARIVSVRPERIRDITEEEAKKDGIVDGGCSTCGNSSYPQKCGCEDPHPEYRDAFIYLWETLHPGSWDRNEWVWVYTLKKLDM